MIPIDLLPDDVLLAIFKFYVKGEHFVKKWIESWQSLVHVCQRWRSVVFGSPRHLNLQLLCTPGTPRGMLDVWPPLSLIVRGHVSRPNMDNIIGALEHRDRVRKIDLYYDSRSPVEDVWAAMQEPFPELEHMNLSGPSRTNTEQVVPDSFLGGSAPRLQFLEWSGIPFPGLPNLLLSTTHLVTLHLSDIPHSGYFTPEAIVTALSRTTSLNKLSLGFRSIPSHPDPESRPPSPLTRTVLPALTTFDFGGASEYLEDLVARINAPRLNGLYIALSHHDFDIPQVVQFISRTPMSKAHDEAHVVIDEGLGKLILSEATGYDSVVITIRVYFGESDFQLSSLARVSSSFLPFVSMVESLYIYENQYLQIDWEDEVRVENTEWLDLLRLYTNVKNLYLSEVFGPGIMRALQGSVEGRTVVVSPTLQSVFLEGPWPSSPVQGEIGQFAAARELSGYPCAVSLWDSGGKF